jgi:hypothetical protein
MTDARDVGRSLRLAREAFSPSTAERERVRAALSARATPPVQKGGAPRVLSRAVALRFGVAKAAVFLGVGFALGYWVAEARGPERALLVAAQPISSDRSRQERGPETGNGFDSKESPVVALDTALPRVEPVPAAPEVSPRPSSRHRGHGAPASSADTAQRFAEELGLLQRAERAIRSGDGALARSFIAELEAGFPRTVWREERGAILVLAACVLDERGAEREARTFLERHAGSVYFDRIRAACRLSAFESEQVPSSDGSASGGH